MRSNLAAVIPSQTVGQRTGQSESKLCRHGSALWREGKQCGQRSAPLRVARKGVRCAEGFLLRSGPRAGLPGPAAWWTQRACTWHSANTRVTAKGAGIGHPENRGVARENLFQMVFQTSNPYTEPTSRPRTNHFFAQPRQHSCRRRIPFHLQGSIPAETVFGPAVRHDEPNRLRRRQRSIMDGEEATEGQQDLDRSRERWEHLEEDGDRASVSESDEAEDKFVQVVRYADYLCIYMSPCLLRPVRGRIDQRWAHRESQ